MYGQEKSVHVRNAHSIYMTYSMCDFSVYGYPHYGKISILNRNFPPKHFPYLWSNPQFSLLFKGKGNVEVMYFKLGTYLP